MKEHEAERLMFGPPEHPSRSDRIEQQFPTLYVSNDAVRWARIGDTRAMEELFGIHGGALSFGIGISRGQRIRTYLGLKTAK